MTSFRLLSADLTTNIELLTDLIGYADGSENLTVCMVTNNGASTLTAVAQAVVNRFSREKHRTSSIKQYAIDNGLRLEVIESGLNAAKVIANSVLPTPTTFAGTVNSATQITLTWGASAGATGYIVKRSTDIGFVNNVATFNLGNVLTLVNSGLVTATKYFYQIQAIGANASSANAATISLTTS